jgi:hypothetical protein
MSFPPIEDKLKSLHRCAVSSDHILQIPFFGLFLLVQNTILAFFLPLHPVLSDGHPSIHDHPYFVAMGPFLDTIMATARYLPSGKLLIADSQVQI